MSQPSAPRSTWSNRWAFVLVTIGSAVGLGNIWKFPYMAGSQGGSAFVLVYLACVLLIALPLLMAEILIGRRGRRNPVHAMLNVAKEAGGSPGWCAVGWAGIMGGLIILSYYCVVAGWILSYFHKAATGFSIDTPEAADAAFAGLLASPGELILWTTVFLAATVGVVARGIVSGIERANKIMMPGLFLILIALTLWGGVAGDMAAALHFMFDFKPDALTSDVILAAMGHAFLSMSLGMGAIMTYGSYLDRQSGIAETSLWVALAGTLVGLLAGLAIFSLTFAHGLEPSAGAGLILKTLPLAFSHMPGGRAFALLFFLLVLFAAWTSAISLLEPFVSWLTESAPMRRLPAAWSTGLAVWLLGVAVCLSFNRWQDYRLAGLNLFEFLDFITSRLTMPLSGLAVAVFVGWVMRRASVADEMRLAEPGFTTWYRVVRYGSPLAIALVFLHVLGVFG